MGRTTSVWTLEAMPPVTIQEEAFDVCAENARSIVRVAVSRNEEIEPNRTYPKSLSCCKVVVEATLVDMR